MKAAVIEDEMSHRMLLCEEIRKWGLDTKEPVSICEYDSAEAFLFDWEDQPSFDVLFIDIQMGQMDGVAMARKYGKRTGTRPWFLPQEWRNGCRWDMRWRRCTIFSNPSMTKN